MRHGWTGVKDEIDLEPIILPGPPQPMLENKSQEEQIQELEGSDDEDEDEIPLPRLRRQQQ